MAPRRIPNQGRPMPRPASAEALPRPVRAGTALVLVAAAGLAWLAPADAADWTFTPRAALNGIWTDNIALAESSSEESEWITELRPGFLLEVDGARAQAQLDYDLQALWYADNSELDDIYHQLNGAADFVILPETLFLDSFARFDQQNVDTGGRVASSNLFETDNRTDTFVFGASPYHVGRWGDWGESLLRYDYQAVRYSNTDPGAPPPEDSDSNTVSAALGSPTASRGFSWRTSGSYALTEFDEADEFEYARVALDLGVPVGLRTRATATVGQESDVAEDATKGGLDSSFWYLGFAWAPSELQSLEAQVGERFFGTAWEVHWRRRGSRGELGLDYTEEPTTSSGVLGDEAIFQPDMGPGGVPTLDSRVFVQKRLAADASYEFTRSVLQARAYSDRREFQDVGSGRETSYGATLIYDWEAAVRTRLGITLDFERIDFESDRTDDLGEATVRLTRELTRRVSGVVRASHFRRNSDADSDYRVNQVSVGVEATF